jgi:hypothetical protein
MENENILNIRNQEVINFYKTHSLDFESMNYLFYTILKKLLINMDTSLHSTLANKLIDGVSQLSKKINRFETNLNKHQQDLSSSILSKFNEYRKEYLQDLKLTLSSNHTEQILPTIKEYNTHFIDKTTLMLNELIPKNNEQLTKNIEYNLKLLQSSFLDETSKLFSQNHSSLNQQKINEFLQTINQTQNVLSSLISNSDIKMDNKLQQLHITLSEKDKLFDSVKNNISNLIGKFDHSSNVTKGTISEMVLLDIIIDLFPTGQIEHVGGQKETADIKLSRLNKPTILIENKEHDNNVPKIDIEKFIRDCDINSCCGILFAQRKGIANKNNFELQIHKNNILLYVHEVNFNKQTIKTAIDIVDNFKSKYDENIANNDSYQISEETLNEINQEYSDFANQRNQLQRMLKDFNDKMNSNIQSLKFPNLEKILQSKYATSSNQVEQTCKYCNKVILKSVKQHYRHCPILKNNKNNQLTINDENENETI